MNTFTKTAALATLLTSALCAQSGTFARQIDFGTADWGGNVRFAGHAGYSDTQVTPLLRELTADLGGESSSTIRMLGRVSQAYRITADWDATVRSQLDLATRTTRRSSAVTSSLNVRIAGTTVARIDATVVQSRSVDLLPLDVFGLNGFSQSFQVGPYAVSARFRATADASATLTPRLSLANLTTGVNLATNVQLEGQASASVSVLGVEAGVDALLDLADPVASVDVSTGFRAATLAANWAVGTIRTHLDLFARLFGVEYRLPIVHLDVPGFSGSASAGL